MGIEYESHWALRTKYLHYNEHMLWKRQEMLGVEASLAEYLGVIYDGPVPFKAISRVTTDSFKRNWRAILAQK